MRLKPASGLKVRDPVTRLHIPAAGLDVPSVDGIPNDPHWQFMLRHGDVVDPDAPPPAVPDSPSDPHGDEQ